MYQLSCSRSFLQYTESANWNVKGASAFPVVFDERLKQYNYAQTIKSEMILQS